MFLVSHGGPLTCSLPALEKQEINLGPYISYQKNKAIFFKLIINSKIRNFYKMLGSCSYTFMKIIAILSYFTFISYSILSGVNLAVCIMLAAKVSSVSSFN